MNVYHELIQLLEDNKDVDVVIIPKQDIQRMIDSWLAMSEKAEIIRKFYTKDQNAI